MDSKSNLIVEEVKSGKYFTEARDWYNRVHVQPLSEISYLGFICIMLVIMLGTALMNLYAAFPVTKKINAVINLPNTLEYYPVIKSIDQPGQSTKAVVTKYLCKRYVLARESYDYAQLSSSYSFIFRSSSRLVFDSYYQSIALSNPNSPIVVYKDKSTVTVDILEENIQTEQGKGNIKFTRLYKDKWGKQFAKRTATATFSFYIDPNFDFSKSDNKPLSFIVTSYEVQDI